MIVDAHVHVFLAAGDDPERTVDHIAPADRAAPVELLEREQRAAGVGGAVLVPLGPEDRYVSQVLASDPQRYAAIAVADPAQTDPGAVAARLHAGGFRGLRVFSLPGALDEGPPWLAVAERLARDGRVLWLYPRPEDLPNVEALAAGLPDLTIVLNHTGFTQAGIDVDHLGRPRIHGPIPQPYEDRVLALARHANVAVVLSGAYGFSNEDYPYLDVAGVTGRVADAFGTDRLAWASDFPWIVDEPGYRSCLELIDLHLPGLSASERQAVLGGTIRRLLRWEAR